MKFVRFKETIDGPATSAVLQEGRLHEIEGNIFGQWNMTGAVYDESKVRLLAPFIPHSIIGVGKNYAAADEAKPRELPNISVLFYKPVSSGSGLKITS